ncbi:MAG: ABC transporter substrate-binding protein [Desulfobacteraceae bacterium]|jgi:branched-chain amino acid transport system substrate-binding protein
MKIISHVKLRGFFPMGIFGCWVPMVLFLSLLLTGPNAAECKQAIKIAAIYALSGAGAEANAPCLRGVRLAVDEINGTGGVLGLPFELIEIDNRSTPIGSKVAAVQAVKHEVTAIIGAAFSSHSIAVARVAQRNGIPMITNVSTSPPVTRIGDCIFRVCFNDLQQGEVMGKFAREQLQAESVVAVFNVASDYSMGLIKTFEKAFVKRGGVMQAKIPYKKQQPHFRNIIDQAKSLRPDVLFIPGHDESARIVVEALQKELNAIPLGGDGWDVQSFYNMGGNLIKLGYYTTHWNPVVESAPSKKFVARYHQSGTILTATALGYDAVHLLADAIERAGTVDRSKIRAALARTRGFEGVTGTISFDNYGDPVKSVVIMKIQDGRPVYFKQITPGDKH